MNHYSAKQRLDRRWDYTCSNNNRVWPTGYCGGYKELTPDSSLMMSPEWCERENAEMNKFAAKFHENGHDTAEEAQECYKQYLLDHEMRLGLISSSTMRKCEVCDAWTPKMAEVSGRVYHLCDDHNNREEVEKRFSVGEIWSS